MVLMYYRIHFYLNNHLYVQFYFIIFFIIIIQIKIYKNFLFKFKKQSCSNIF